MTVIAASVGGVLLIVLVLIVIFLGTGYGLTRRGSGIASHPRQDREADQAPGAGPPGSEGPDGRPRDEG